MKDGFAPLPPVKPHAETRTEHHNSCGPYVLVKQQHNARTLQP